MLSRLVREPRQESQCESPLIGIKIRASLLQSEKGTGRVSTVKRRKLCFQPDNDTGPQAVKCTVRSGALCKEVPPGLRSWRERRMYAATWAGAGADITVPGKAVWRTVGVLINKKSQAIAA